MRIIIQRVKSAHVAVDNMIIGAISAGLLLYIGIEKSDTKECIMQTIDKLLVLRLFPGEEEKQNFHISVEESKSPLLVISQFTLYGNLSKGRRPSFDHAAPPESARELYTFAIDYLTNKHRGPISCGQFQAHMNVISDNDGPITFILDSTSL